MGFIFSSLGAGEILLVLAAALLLFGAEKLPAIARSLGQALNEMRRAAGDLTRSITESDAFSASDQKSSQESNRQGIEETKREG